MFREAKPLIIKAMSPIHAGSGRELGVVDMPIQRESHTGIPKIEGSSLKGSLREWTRLKKEWDIDKLFGAEKGDEGAGLIGFSDAKLLFYPIKTLSNIFAYVTCPYLLERFSKELQIASVSKKDIFEDLIREANKIPQEKAIIISSEENKDKSIEQIELDEYSFAKHSFSYENSQNLYDIFGLQKKRYIVILCDQDFIELISLCKEIITRNKINSITGIVEEGQLFTEEYLPAETILFTLILENGIENKNNLVETYKDLFKQVQYMQIGGNTNIGKGIVEMYLYERV